MDVVNPAGHENSSFIKRNCSITNIFDVLISGQLRSTQHVYSYLSNPVRVLDCKLLEVFSKLLDIHLDVV